MGGKLRYTDHHRKKGPAFRSNDFEELGERVAERGRFREQKFDYDVLKTWVLIPQESTGILVILVRHGNIEEAETLTSACRNKRALGARIPRTLLSPPKARAFVAV